MKKKLENAVKSGNVEQVRALLIELLDKAAGKKETIESVTYAVSNMDNLFDADDGTVYELKPEAYTEAFADSVRNDLKRNFSSKKLHLYTEVESRLATVRDAQIDGKVDEAQEEELAEVDAVADAKPARKGHKKAKTATDACAIGGGACSIDPESLRVVSTPDVTEVDVSASCETPDACVSGPDDTVDALAATAERIDPGDNADSGIAVAVAEDVPDKKDAAGKKDAGKRAPTAPADDAVVAEVDEVVVVPEDENVVKSRARRRKTGYTLLALGAATAIVGICVPPKFLIGLGIGVLLLGSAVTYTSIK